MGVEYRHFVLPENPLWVPSPAQLAELLKSLTSGRFVPDLDTQEPDFQFLSVPGELPQEWDEAWADGLSEEDWQLSWDLTWPGELRYGFTDTVYEENYYTLSLRHCTRLLHPYGECIEPLANTRCSCGAGLIEAEEHPLFGCVEVLLPVCPRCLKDAPLDRITAGFQEGWSPGRRQLQAGATHRFGLVIDTGKCLPTPEAPPQLVAELTQLFPGQARQVYEIY